MSADTLETVEAKAEEVTESSQSVAEESGIPPGSYLRVGASEIQETINYLAARPWNEVHKLMGVLVDSIRTLNS